MVPDFVQGFSVVKNIITHPLIEAEKEPEQPVQYSVTPSIIREFTKLQTPQKILSPMPYFNTGSQDSIPNVSDIMGNETLEAALAGGGMQYALGDTSTLMGFIMSTQCSPPQGPTNHMAEELMEAMQAQPSFASDLQQMIASVHAVREKLGLPEPLPNILMNIAEGGVGMLSPVRESHDADVQTPHSASPAEPAKSPTK